MTFSPLQYRLQDFYCIWYGLQRIQHSYVFLLHLVSSVDEMDGYGMGEGMMVGVLQQNRQYFHPWRLGFPTPMFKCSLKCTLTVGGILSSFTSVEVKVKIMDISSWAYVGAEKNSLSKSWQVLNTVSERWYTGHSLCTKIRTILSSGKLILGFVNLTLFYKITIQVTSFIISIGMHASYALF